MSAKSKSALPATPNAKPSPAAPRVSKPGTGRGQAKPAVDKTSSVQNGRRSIDRPPKLITSNTTLDRASPKLTTPPDKKATRVLKPSELQAGLNQAQEDLKKANAKLVLAEQEKVMALDELKEAQRLSKEANEKLKEALVAQRRAKENSEIEKFRAVEMEQAVVETTQRKEEQWQNELKEVKNEHTVDAAALLSATQELEKVKQELAMTCEAKNEALSHAYHATKIAEVHAEKIEALSVELVHLRAELDMRVEVEAVENDELVSELKLEMDSLRRQLDKEKIFEEKLAKKEAAVEQLSVDLEAAKMAELCARNLVEELREKVNNLTSEMEQAKKLEKSASESMESIMKQMEESNDSLHDAENEIVMLKEKVGLLEISSERQNRDVEKSQRRLEVAKEEAYEMVRKVEMLKFELENAREERSQALNNEKLAAESVQTLLEEKNKLINELEASRDEEEKSKKALESLASALHEVSSEARDAKEKLFIIQAERENYEMQIEDMRLALKETNENYESMLDDAREEIDFLSNSFERSKHDYDELKADLEQKEVHLMKKSKEDKSCLENEINRLVNLLKRAEGEACDIQEEGESWKKSLREAETEVVYLKEVADEAKSETIRLKEDLVDKDKEMHDILVESKALRKREADSIRRAEELTKLLEEALLAKEKKKQEEDNGEATDSEKDYDMLPKVVEFSEQNGTCHEPPQRLGQNEDNAQEVVDSKMWESCKIDEHEPFDNELSDTKLGDGVLSSGAESVVDNGGSLQLQSQKKKKALLGKFGGLLKKKGNTNHK